MDKINYHPNYFQQGGAVRHGCQKRLDLIKKHVKSGSLLDIGCSEGFYSFGLADYCEPILAIDKEQSLIEKCHQIKGSRVLHIDFWRMGVDELIRSIGAWDFCLYMSVHHHIIAQFSMEVANNILRTLSKKCNCMFFDMGQKDEQNCASHKWWQLLPSNGDQKKWLLEYLLENTVYKDIQLIGSSRIHNTERLLWKLTK